MARNVEAYMPSELVLRVLASADQDVVLVGGQALAFWMDRYGIRQPGDLPAVSRDVDFFTRDATNSAPLQAFARAIRGRANVLPPEAITALIGSAIAQAGDERIYNVDLLHAVVGLSRDEIERNAVLARLRGVDHAVRIMHPLHVLQSRNANLHELKDKQNDMGRLQFRLAVEVARRFLELEVDRIEAATDVPIEARDRAIFDIIAAVDEYSAEDAASKNASRYGIHLADAIPAWRITSPVFWSKQWQFLRARMSPAYAAHCEQNRPAR